jgi:preprotein translocase subunit SecB
MNDSEPAAESSFRFIGFNLTRFEFVRAESLWQHMPLHSLEISRSAYPHDQQSIIVKVSVSIAWQKGGPFSLAIEGVGRFDYDRELDPQALQRLTDFQAPALVYTQLRPIARLVAAEAGFPGFILPTVNFAQMAQSSSIDAASKEPQSLPE